MSYSRENISSDGSAIGFNGAGLDVPDNPLIPVLTGDGAGPEMAASAMRILDSAISMTYNGEKQIHWKEVQAGEINPISGNPGILVSDECLDFIRKYKVALRGSFNHPAEKIKGVEFLISQALDLYTCVKPMKYYAGLPCGLKNPEGIRLAIISANHDDSVSIIPPDVNISAIVSQGLKTSQGPGEAVYSLHARTKLETERLVRSAIRYAMRNKLTSISLVRGSGILGGNEEKFLQWSFEMARNEFTGRVVASDDCGGNAPPGTILVRDVTPEVFFQQAATSLSCYGIIIAPEPYAGMIGSFLNSFMGSANIAAEACINYETGMAVFGSAHPTSPKLAGHDKANPISLIISGIMLLRYIGWIDAADMIEGALEKTIASKSVTYDLARFIDGAREVKCSEFTDLVIKNLVNSG